MPFVPVDVLDPERLRIASENLCRVFGVPSLRSHQETAGQNIVRGITTFLDIPTGGGKTLAFWYALFYYWSPGNVAEDCQKIVLVVGPLTALMDSQARALSERGIPAVSITSTSENIGQLLADLGANKYRVAFVGPEMAVGALFHEKVLTRETFLENLISLILDEAHCVSEWGTDDFRPDFARISTLLARLPSGLPILAASATLPREIILDIQHTLRLPSNTASVQVSNEKLNVALSVRILRHPPETYADLISFFPQNASGPMDFPQTLIYANGRQEVEKIQDFLRRNCPEGIPAEVFEFYHRHIDEPRKTLIQNAISDGTWRGVAATDALGLGMDFQHVIRVLLWMVPRTFLSLVQKIGRCVRLFHMLGEAVLFVTKAAYTRYCVELDMMKREEEPEADEEEDEVAGGQGTDQAASDGAPMDRDAAAVAVDGPEDDDEEIEPPPKRPRKNLKVMSALEARDRRYLLEYIVTEECRRIAWNKFFGNDKKMQLEYPVPPGARCCDNCDRDRFPVETIQLFGGHRLRTGRRGKSSEELEDAVRARLQDVREVIILRDFPGQHFITGNIILPDVIITVMAVRARLVTTIANLLQETRWHYSFKYGEEVVRVIQEVVAEFPDLEGQAREAATAERQKKSHDREMDREIRGRLTLVFDGCYEAVSLPTRAVTKGRGKTRRTELVQLCQPFLQVPRISVWPEYHEQIADPISMKNINAFSHKPTHYQSLNEYRDAWHLMFNNARQFNTPGSQIYEDADFLQKVFDRKLYVLSTIHNIPGHELLPDDLLSPASSPSPPRAP